MNVYTPGMSFEGYPLNELHQLMFMLCLKNGFDSPLEDIHRLRDYINAQTPAPSQ
jgi:hypothetical protein